MSSLLVKQIYSYCNLAILEAIKLVVFNTPLKILRYKLFLSEKILFKSHNEHNQK